LARFEHHCEGWDRAVFGAISYNSTAPYRVHAIPTEVGAGSSPAGVPIDRSVVVENLGPAPLSVTAALISGSEVTAFAVVGDGCTGVPLAAGSQCSLTVRFASWNVGSFTATLTIFDDIAPSGGTGRDVRLTGTATAAPPPPPPPPVADPTGEFTPLTPARVLDTRDGTGDHRGPLGTNGTIDVQIAGRGGVPSVGAAAVVMNVTVTEPTLPSFLTVWPTGMARPLVSNLNFVAGQTVPNLVTVALGLNGWVSAYNLQGSVHVVFDVVGYYASGMGTVGSRFHATDPFRLFDTRDDGIPLGQGETLSIDLTYDEAIPPGSVTGLIMNVTVTEPTLPSYLTVFPGDVARPLASNLNYVAGLTVPNLVVVRVPASNVISFYNNTGATHVLADVVG
jgi:hypothetical protein